MPKRLRIAPAIRRQLTEMDGRGCACSRSPTIVGIPLIVEHILPLVAGGSSLIDNLCLSCYRCNEFKGPRTQARDPLDGQNSPLYHPRQQRWSDHFGWSADATILHGLTAYGRATIEALHLNNDWIVQARRIWIGIGLHPPLE